MRATAVPTPTVRAPSAPIAACKPMPWPYRDSPMAWMWCCWWADCASKSIRRWLRFIRSYSSGWSRRESRSPGGKFSPCLRPTALEVEHLLDRSLGTQGEAVNNVTVETQLNQWREGMSGPLRDGSLSQLEQQCLGEFLARLCTFLTQEQTAQDKRSSEERGTKTTLGSVGDVGKVSCPHRCRLMRASTS
jgi:hypothetical protein